MDSIPKNLTLSVSIDYYTDGRDNNDILTAAGLVIRQSYPTIEQGVKIDRVSVFNNGDLVAVFPSDS